MEKIIVEFCPRCQGHHEIEIHQFKESHPLNDTYWSMCPVINEPILIDMGVERRALDELCKIEDKKVFESMSQER